MTENVLNLIDNEWRASSSTEYLDVVNPATVELLGRTPLSPVSEVAQAAEAAARALAEGMVTQVLGV